jgi:DGQHR domain-containing protein
MENATSNKVARKAPPKHTGPKSGRTNQPVGVRALRINQGGSVFYAFTMAASRLWPMVSINRRSETEDRGYQRVLSQARVAAVATHIKSGKPLPNSVLVALDSATYDEKTSTLQIPAGEDIGWVIDGQHRIAGSHEASSEVDIELCVFAFVGVDEQFQIEQFITINREAKGVPTALVYDLLSHLPDKKKPIDVANERAAEIATELRKDKSSPFYERIVVTQAPGKGKLSITNFVRKVSPLVHPERGALKTFTLPEQKSIMSNYFAALKKTFPEQWLNADNIFFRTLGFGAMMNVFEEIFTQTMASQGGFTIQNIEQMLSGIKHFEFIAWESHGTGNKAEMEAANDFRTDLNRSLAQQLNNKRIKL